MIKQFLMYAPLFCTLVDYVVDILSPICWKNYKQHNKNPWFKKKKKKKKTKKKKKNKKAC